MKSSLEPIFKEANRNFKIIEDTYKLLEVTYDMKLNIHPAGQWLLDNMYIIEQEYENIKASKKSLSAIRLPLIKTNDGQKNIATYLLACELIEENTGYVDQNLILNCLKNHQKSSYLTFEELVLFEIMLKFALLKFIARVCANVYNSQMQKINVEKLLDKDVLNTGLLGNILFKNLKNFKDNMVDIGKIKNTNTAFVEYMAYRLKELGTEGDKYYKILNDEADKIGFTVEESIIKEHMEMAKTTDYIGRAILAYKQVNGINFREVVENVNKIDEALMFDYSDEFRKCDYKTKNRYRQYIIKLAKNYSLSEVYVAKKVVECSIKYKKHVGFFLIGDYRYLLKKELGKIYIFEKWSEKYIKPLDSYFYVFSAIGISLFAAIYFTIFVFNFKSLFPNILVALLSFVFAMEIWSKLLDYIIRKFIKPEILPRYDFSKTVDEKNTTYVVMPTVISSIEKLDNMIKKMEITYLANRSKNIYYMLLGDCISSDKQNIDLDDKIVEYAEKKLKALNEKYPDNHVLFNFMYRKRVYSKGEGSYMGWERKRGALSEFNKLILGKYDREQIDQKMYLIYDDIVKAKYAITIDEDTSLSLNSAKDLVAIIAHPLNKPVVTKGVVTSGYGLIQPSVSLDIESANKSIFSKIFGGFGGLDIYTTAVSNTYQDVFNEAIFCGKGVYDVELFEVLLGMEIPENLVLSHDLLEGSYLKTGLASDIEVQDGFPNNYIAYMKRNHRWYRGDMQIIKWLISPNSKLNLLSKWKIFDNYRRPMVSVFVLIALIFSLFINENVFLYTILISFLVINFGYIISILDMVIFGKSTHMKEVQYIPLIHGVDALLLTMVFNYITVPYRSYIVLSAFISSIYRMVISKKHLLQWTTADVLERTSKNTLSYYTFNMITNVLFGLFICLYSVFIAKIELRKINCYFEIFIGAFFILAPVFAYLLGKSHLFGRKTRLDLEKDVKVVEIAKRTWKFFETLMSENNNYLPADNYQEDRRLKIVTRTSATNIGFAVLSIIDAYDLKFITLEDAIVRLSKLIGTIKKLDKWNGHLYNWYNIRTLEPLRPRFVSTVDSGNFVACFYVLKQFLTDIKGDEIVHNYQEYVNDLRIIDMISYIDEYIDSVDYTKLYDTTRNLFSIGYDQESGKLIDSYYDMLMSENRTTSLIAIASRQITSKHWFSLTRNMVNVDGYKGLVSWSGTAFEYFMPYLFMKSYPHTLIDQSLFFTKFSQKKYAKLNNIPWGISESAFALRDNDLNYQYQAFGVPWQGLKRGLKDSLVIAPYASLLMIEYTPQEVFKNIRQLKKLNTYSSFGFYESVDYTKQNIPDDKTYEVVRTYMAHHQGMVLTAINNYINAGIIKKRFHKNPDISACEILLKERERLTTNAISKKSDYNKVIKEKIKNIYTPSVSRYTKTKSDIKDEDIHKDYQIALLKGKGLSGIFTSSGATFLRYKGKIVNKQIFSDLAESGNYLYITDKTDNRSYCVTDSISRHSRPLNKFSFSNDLNSIEYYREDDVLETTTTVFLSQEYNMEIMRVSIYNNSDTRREILINTYIEPSLTDYVTNIVHPSFNNLQIETYYDNNLDVLVASKRLKNENDKGLYLYSKLIGIDLEKDVETEKAKLVSNTVDAYDTQVSNYPLWPVLSYRAQILLDAHERQEFFYVVGVEENKYDISNTIINLDTMNIEKQYKFGSELNNVIAKYLKLAPGKAAKYNELIKQILFGKPNIDVSKYWNENLNQSMLWKYSISGDFPIMLVYVNKIEDSGIIDEVINFMDYAKNRKVTIDIVILIDEEELKYGPIYTYVKTRIDRASYTDYTAGNIYVLNVNGLNDDEIKLFSLLSRKYITDISELIVQEQRNKVSILNEIPDNNQNTSDVYKNNEVSNENK